MFEWFPHKKKKDKLTPINFSVLRTDIHSHFIPGIDDGSPDLETSILLIQKMKELGFRKVITTPHIISDFYRNTPEIINNGLKVLREELKTQKIEMEIDVAAEYYIDFDFEQKIGKEKLLTFGENYILIELSFIEAPMNFHKIIFKLQLEGYKVVLAHPARYSFFKKEDYQELVNKGVLMQINLLSMIGYYSSWVKKQAEWLIEKKMVSFVGSDCHNINQANLFMKCYSEKSWHNLVNSGTLLNHTL